MIKEKTTYRWLWNCLIAGGLLLTGCTDHSDEVQPTVEYSPLELQAVTRTNGAYSIPSTLYNISPDIHLYLTTAESSTPEVGDFQFDSFDKRWKSNVIKIKEEAQYYMYGYMPNEFSNAVLSVPEGVGKSFADGADLSLTSLPAITDKDICVIVGVQKVSSTTFSNTPDVDEGNYGYFSGIKGENFVNLLMDHLYASIELNFKLDPTYAELRSIHLKTVTLKSSYGTVNASVSLRPRPVHQENWHGIGTPTFVKNSNVENPVQVLFLDRSAETAEVLDENYTSTPLTLKTLAYCAPCIFSPDATNLSLTTIYDVYDKEGHNLGERTSVNVINIASLPTGQKRKLTLTVNPTYLYILSNWDIDNPEFVIE